MRCGRAVLPSLRGDREEEKPRVRKTGYRKKRGRRRDGLTLYPPLRSPSAPGSAAPPPPVEVEGLAVEFADQWGVDRRGYSQKGSCCIPPPPVKLLRLSGESFFFLVIVLLRKYIMFLDFPRHPNVLNRKSDITSER